MDTVSVIACKRNNRCAKSGLDPQTSNQKPNFWQRKCPINVVAERCDGAIFRQISGVEIAVGSGLRTANRFGFGDCSMLVRDAVLRRDLLMLGECARRKRDRSQTQ